MKRRKMKLVSMLTLGLLTLNMQGGVVANAQNESVSEEYSQGVIDETELGHSYQMVVDAYRAAATGEMPEIPGGDLNFEMINRLVENQVPIHAVLADIDFDQVNDLLIIADNLVIDSYTEMEGVAIQFLPMSEMLAGSEIFVLSNGRLILNNTEDGETGTFLVYEFHPEGVERSQIGHYEYDFSEEIDQPVYDVNQNQYLTYQEYVDAVGLSEAEIIPHHTLDKLEIYQPEHDFEESEEESSQEQFESDYAVDYGDLARPSSFGINALGLPQTIDFYPKDHQLVFHYPSYDGYDEPIHAAYYLEYHTVEDLVIDVLPADNSKEVKQVTVASQIYLVRELNGVNDEYDEFAGQSVYAYYNNEGTVSLAIPEKVGEDRSDTGLYQEYTLLDQ